MTVRRPLVHIAGIMGELPSGDMLPKLVVLRGTNSSSGATITFPIGTYVAHQLTIGAATTIAITGWVAANFCDILLKLDNAAAFPTTFPVVNWVKTDGTTTTTFATSGITLQTSGTDWVYLWSIDGGTTVFGRVLR